MTKYKYLVYKVTFPNNKIYIGITSKKLEKRKQKHYQNINKKTKFYNALKKYSGSEIWEHFCSPFSWKDACRLEKYFIQYFDSYKNGYNSTLGGEGTFGKKLSQNTKNKIRNSVSGSKNANFNRYGSLNYNAKKIKCLELNIIYGSLSEAAKELNINMKQISKVLRGQNKSAKGFTFKYIGDDYASI